MSSPGRTLHPVDLATKKVLALVGRLEVRDWVDVIASNERVQQLGYFAWAASGKDPGLGPRAILETATRTARYSAEEVGQLAFEGEIPDAGDLARTWHGMLDMAREIVPRHVEPAGRRAWPAGGHAKSDGRVGHVNR